MHPLTSPAVGRTRTATLCVAVLALSACGGSSGKKLSESELSRLVVQQRDVPTMTRFANGREVLAEQSPVLGRDPARFGRQGGWIVRYRQAHGVHPRGPLTLASGIEAFGKSSGAADFLSKVKELDDANLASSGFARADAGGIGDVGFAYASRPRGGDAVKFVTVVWRNGRFVGSVSASGYKDRMTTASVLELARQQNATIENAD